MVPLLRRGFSASSCCPCCARGCEPGRIQLTCRRAGEVPLCSGFSPCLQMPELTSMDPAGAELLHWRRRAPSFGCWGHLTEWLQNLWRMRRVTLLCQAPSWCGCASAAACTGWRKAALDGYTAAVQTQLPCNYGVYCKKPKRWVGGSSAKSWCGAAGCLVLDSSCSVVGGQPSWRMRSALGLCCLELPVSVVRVVLWDTGVMGGTREGFLIPKVCKYIHN